MKHIPITVAAALLFLAADAFAQEERAYGRATLYGTLTVYHPEIPEEPSLNHDYFLLELAARGRIQHFR